MPLVLDTPRSIVTDTPSSTTTIEIALLNNLGDAGLETAERQIVDLLAAAAGSHVVRLRFFSLPQITRGSHVQARLDERYTDFKELMQSRVDGLIVTGCEPRSASLPAEPYWAALTEIIDWAEHNTRSTIWSCRAAHAAVLHLDGIPYRPLAEKCTGLFPVKRVCEHPLLAGLRGAHRVPHSRYNDLPKADLVASGYKVLTHSPTIGVDLFVKQWQSLFVYLQGHPEYDAQALRREYRRDVWRFLDGGTRAYPNMPRGYFSTEMEAALRDFSDRAQRGAMPEPGVVFPLKSGGTQRPWQRTFAKTLFKNWLTHVQAADHAA